MGADPVPVGTRTAPSRRERGRRPSLGARFERLRTSSPFGARPRNSERGPGNSSREHLEHLAQQPPVLAIPRGFRGNQAARRETDRNQTGPCTMSPDTTGGGKLPLLKPGVRTRASEPAILQFPIGAVKCRERLGARSSTTTEPSPNAARLSRNTPSCQRILRHRLWSTALGCADSEAHR